MKYAVCSVLIGMLAMIPVCLLGQEVNLSPTKVKSQQLQAIKVHVWAGNAEDGELVREDAFIYNGAGKLVQKQSKDLQNSELTTLACAYDQFGQRIKEEVIIPHEGVHFVAQKKITYHEGKRASVEDLVTGIIDSYTYCADGKILEIQSHLDGELWIASQQFKYDEEGRVSSVHEHTDTWTKSRRIEYNFRGQPAKELFHKTYEDPLEQPKKILITYSYNRHGQLIGKHMRNQQNGKTRSLKYTYDIEGHLTRIKEGSEIMAYDWDARGRITEVRQQRGGTILWTKRYDYQHESAEKKYTHTPVSSSLPGKGL